MDDSVRVRRWEALSSDGRLVLDGPPTFVIVAAFLLALAVASFCSGI